jgi:hypothetical protein
VRHRASVSGYTLTNDDRRKRLGHVQRRLRRALIGLNRPVQIRELLPLCYPRAQRFEAWMRNSIHRAAKRIAQPLWPTRERFASSWVLKESDGNKDSK